MRIAWSEWELAEGGIAPLGVTWDDDHQCYQFVLYSQDAGAVTLNLYGAGEYTNPLVSIPLVYPQNKTSRFWHVRVSGESAGPAKYYAYQAAGPTNPDATSRFDPDKILLDPYARGVFFPPEHSRAAACAPGSNAGKAPLGVLPARVPPPPSNSRPMAPRHAHDLIIYEMHVRGFTADPSSGVVAGDRGSFNGIAAKIPYLKSLGVTAVELMPVHQFDPDEGNYWGYMTLSFFAPHSHYGDAAEFRAMVDALHAAGIEVFLDVVYNHTTEEGLAGPTYSFRGIDNGTYYVLDQDDNYVNYSACGNDMRTSHAVVRRLVMDSLRYWAGEMGVDGFRFDLASILARTDAGELDTEDPPLISEMSSDPLLSRVRLVAEPWQGAYGSGYMMGQVFPGKTWRQWNDHFRETVRGFVKSDDGLVNDLMMRLYGSSDLFPDDLASGFRPAQSMNYVDSHDGFCMYDLVSYTDAGQNSWDCGGDEALRRQQVKNFCLLLMLSNGTPMFHMGDEFLRTQQGDANPWDQDNSKTWVDWTLLSKNDDVFAFWQQAIQFRKDHPVIARSTGWREHVTWYPNENSRALAYHLQGSDVGDADLFVMINAYWDAITFRVQPDGAWQRVIETAPAPDSLMKTVAARSIAVLVRS